MRVLALLLLLCLPCLAADGIRKVRRARPVPPRPVSQLAAPAQPVPTKGARIAVAIVTNKPPILVSLNLDWTAGQGVTNQALFYGTNSGAYFAQTNTPIIGPYRLTFWRVRSRDYFFVLRSNIGDSNEIKWPPPPPPPWTAFELSWGTSCAVTIEQTTDFRHWSTVTNLVGTNVLVPNAGTAAFFRTRSTVPVALRVRGAYY